MIDLLAIPQLYNIIVNNIFAKNVYLLFIFYFGSAHFVNAYDMEFKCDEHGKLMSYSYKPNLLSLPTSNEKIISSSSLQKTECRNCNSQINKNAILVSNTNRVLNAAMATAAQNPISSKFGIAMAKQQALLADCSSAAQDDAHIAITYPFRGPLSNKSATNYDKNKIQYLIDKAIALGLDPFMALAIVLLENPPLDIKQGEDKAYSGYYSEQYGLMPIDQIAGVSEMNCNLNPQPQYSKTFSTSFEEKYLELGRKDDGLFTARMLVAKHSYVGGKSNLSEKQAALIMGMAKQSSDIHEERVSLEERISNSEDLSILKCKDEKGCKGVLSRQKVVPVLALIEPSNNNVKKTRLCKENNWVSTALKLDISAQAEGQCCVDVLSDVANSNSETIAQTKSLLGLKYAKRRSQNAIDSNHSLSWALQGYNGRSCNGCRETSGTAVNLCLSKIDMGLRPVYGAQIADLIINSLMRNPVIQQMVSDSSNKNQLQTISVFCLKEGEGVHKISDLKFLEEQKKYLLQYEPDRAKLCGSYFR